MELTGKISDELLVCKICYGRFSNSKLPKLLSCSHTFCEPCVLKSYKSVPRRRAVRSGRGDLLEDPPLSLHELPCPLCRKGTQLTGGVENLANNFTVLSLIELLGSSATPEGMCSPTTGATSSAISSSVVAASATSTDQDTGATAECAGGPPGGSSSVGEDLEGDRCVMCWKKFPESQFLCGHCICERCLDMWLRTHTEDCDKCPICRPNQVDRTDSLLNSGTHSSTESSDPNKGPSIRCVDASGVMQSAAASRSISSTGSSQTTPIHNSQTSPSSAGSPEDNDACDSSQTEQKCKELDEDCCKNDTCSGASGGPTAPRRERPPPFNPGFHNKAEVTSLGSNLSRRSSQVTLSGSPQHFTRGRRRSPYNGGSNTNSLYGGSLYNGSHTYESPAVPDEIYISSTQSETCYGLSHSYDSPATLRRSQSLRRPPVPPRRYGSAPGIYNSVRGPRLRPEPCSATSAEDLKGQDNAAYSESCVEDDGVEAFQSPSTLYGVTPPVPPPRRIYDSPHSSPVKCVKKFGRYSEVRMQTSSFRQPSKVAISDKGDIVVTDTQNMTVQVFTMAGDYLSMFKVLGVQGASFVGPDKLAIASHRGIDVSTMSGEKIKELSIGPTVSTAPFKFGFVAATPKSLLIYRQSLTLVKEISKWKVPSPTKKWSPLHKKKTNMEFVSLRDVAVLSNKTIATLDTGRGCVYVMDEDGHCVMTIDPSKHSCGPVNHPEAVTATCAFINGGSCKPTEANKDKQEILQSESKDRLPARQMTQTENKSSRRMSKRLWTALIIVRR